MSKTGDRVTVTFIQPDGAFRDVTSEEGSSLMRAAVNNDVSGIVGDCGGSMSCATCHVYVDDAWTARVGPAGEDEQFMLEFVPDPRASSRLACQVRLEAGLDGLIVHVPETQSH